MLNDAATVLGYGVLCLSALTSLILILLCSAWCIGRILKKLKMFWQIAYMVGNYKKVRSLISALPNNGNHVTEKAIFDRAQRADGVPSNPTDQVPPQDRSNSNETNPTGGHLHPLVWCELSTGETK